MNIEINKSIALLFIKIKEKHPILSSYMVSVEVCKLIKFKRATLERFFLSCVEQGDYDLDEIDYENADEDFKKEFTSAKDYNEKIQGQLVANLMQMKGEGSKAKTISGSFAPPLNVEMKNLKERIIGAKFSNKTLINLYL